MGKLLAALVGVLATAFAAVTLAAAPAGAHAFLTGSTPADGSTVSHSPRVLYLDFSESVEVAATRIDIVDNAGRHLRPEGIHLVGRPSDDTELPSRLAVALAPLPRSAYTVSWQTVSSDDLHATSGVFVFGVGEAVRAAPFSEPAPRLDEAGLRWVVFLGFALAAGAAMWTRLALRAGARRRSRDLERARRVGLAGAAGAAVTAVLLLVDQLAASGSGWHALVDSGYSLRWVVREAGLATLAVGLLATTGAARARTTLLLFGTAATALGSALLGHSATGGPTQIAADAVHTAATAIWAGTLLQAVIVLVVGRRRGGPRRVARVLREFRAPALVAVAATVITGLYLASGVVGSVDAALRTQYGRVLLLKLVVVAGAVGRGARNTLRLPSRPRLQPKQLIGESAAAVAALGLAAVLTSGQPATEQHFVATDGPAVVAIQSSEVGDLTESLALRPNRPGDTAAVVSVFDTRRPAPGPIVGVAVQVAGQRVAARPLANGTWSAPVSLAAPGVTAVVITVAREGRPEARREFRWVVGGAGDRTATPLVSTAPVADLLVGAAGLLTVAAAVAGAIGFAAARRLRREPPPRDASTSAPAELVGTGGG
jgi:copper transport protein